jgi:hypothetical protein
MTWCRGQRAAHGRRSARPPIEYYEFLESHGIYSQFAFFESTFLYRVQKKDEELLAHVGGRPFWRKSWWD